jgi:hypothetical protein
VFFHKFRPISQTKITGKDFSLSRRKSLNNRRIYIHFVDVTLGRPLRPATGMDPAAVWAIVMAGTAGLGRLIITAGNFV